MALNTISLKKQGPIATLTLDRPERLNAMNRQMTLELPVALEEVRQDASVRVMILTGAGRAFCSGGDLTEPTATVYGGTVQEISRQLLSSYQETTLKLVCLEIPTIAMVNGIASGWGFDLALACDIRIGSPETRLLVAYTKAGLTPAAGGAWLMPRVMGLAKACELTFTADIVEAEEALRLGILNRLVPADDLEKETLAMAERIAKGPPQAMRLAKLQLRRGLGLDLEAALGFGAACQAMCLTSEDHAEALAAFREKRSPVFKGS